MSCWSTSYRDYDPDQLAVFPHQCGGVFPREHRRQPVGGEAGVHDREGRVHHLAHGPVEQLG